MRTGAAEKLAGLILDENQYKELLLALHICMLALMRQ